MIELVFVLEEAPEGGFAARALGVSIFTEADTLAELPDKVRDAVRCHFEEAKAPSVIRLHHVREEVIALWGFPAIWREATSLKLSAISDIRSLVKPVVISV
jgi:hypothetical protein